MTGQCGNCKFAKRFCAPDSGGDKTDGVECTNKDMIRQHYKILGRRHINEDMAVLWRTEVLDISCDYWELEDTDASNDS